MEGKNCLLQLLNESDKPVKEAYAKNNQATFHYIKPGNYYLRLIVDDNDNGKWDTGDYATQRQPEAVYYYPRLSSVRLSVMYRERGIHVYSHSTSRSLQL